MLNFLLICSLIINSLQVSKVYFTREISSDKIVEMFQKLKVNLKGRVGLKVHSGEKDGIYYLRPAFLQKIYDYTNGTFIECNAAYENWRHNTSIHKRLAEEHGWYENNRRFVIMDEDPSMDFNISIPKHKKIDTNTLGHHIKEFDSCIVLAHFKGHPMGGFGGSLKQLSIGFASQAGKTNIHTAGITSKWREMDDHLASQLDFTASMGDAATSVVDYFRKRGGIAFINVIVNVSKICDCGGGPIVPPPRVHDIGILASLDPVAIDRAAIDLLNKTNDVGTADWFNQVKTLEGMNTIYVAEENGAGSQKYKLIDVDFPEKGDDDDDEDKYQIWEIVLFSVIALMMITIIGMMILCYCKILKKEASVEKLDNHPLTETLNSTNK